MPAGSSPPCRSFRMRLNAVNSVDIVLNSEIESPVAVDPCLPEVMPFIVLLGLERRVTQIPFQECQLFVEGISNLSRGAGDRDQGAVGKDDDHRNGRMDTRRARRCFTIRSI